MPAWQPKVTTMLLPHLTDPEVLEQLLARAGTAPVHKLGQNFLVCDEPIEAIVSTLTDTVPLVTELGSGAGALTQALLVNNYAVRAIEKDQRLIELLKGHLPKKLRSNLTLVPGDLRDLSWEHDEPWQLVGNIPYNLSGLIIRRLTQLVHPPTQAILMVQQEVGENMTAQAPQMTLLSVIMQLWGEAHLLLTIPADCYLPKPKVQSALVLLVPHEKQLPRAEREQIIGLAKRFFGHRRKQIGGIMKNQLHIEPDLIAATLAETGLEGTARPQELTVEDWKSLAEKLP
ncbi:ribosomal RNA small subunit methyltransferase A [bacterium]|nr:ribosomal RNA small subunit methyltransferase A [bacterium]